MRIGMSQSATPATQNDMTQLRTRQKSHIFATFLIGTATLRPRRLQTEKMWECHKNVGMSQSATPATQNDMTTSSDTSKKSRFCDFSHRHGNFAPTTAADGRLRTVANGCGRLRTPEAGSREHGSTPRPPNVKPKPFATHSGKIKI